MKQFFLFLSCSVLFSQDLFSSTLDLIKEEYQGWIVFKKSDDLYVAKEYRYNSDPVFFAYSFNKGDFLENSLAESLWNQFDCEYEQHFQNNENNKDVE